MHCISALSVIRFIDIKLVKCDLSLFRQMQAGHGIAQVYVHLRHPRSTNQPSQRVFGVNSRAHEELVCRLQSVVLVVRCA
jgi:hypothetical protein